jgi:microsomal dipeptidase-like Zn-dependent dipeptidase
LINSYISYFEDTKGVIRIRKSKDRQHICQRKKDIQENLDQENLNSSLCIHDARNFDEYTQVLAGDTTNKMTFLGGEEGAALCNRPPLL